MRQSTVEFCLHFGGFGRMFVLFSFFFMFDPGVIVATGVAFLKMAFSLLGSSLLIFRAAF